jgi:glycogen debranching enzyme
MAKNHWLSPASFLFTLILLFAVLPCIWTPASAGFSRQPHRTHVAYLVAGSRMTSEDSAAVAWLNGDTSFTTSISQVDGPGWKSPECDVLWIHCPDSTSYSNLQDRPSLLKQLRSFLSASGRIVASGYAAFLPSDLGIEPIRASVRMDTLKDDWLWDKKGYHSFRGHPLLHNLFGGEYVWDAIVDHVLPIVGYFGDAWPAKGKVVAVEKSYVFLHGNRKVALEHSIGKGRILSLGGMIFLAQPNHLRRNMEQFMENALLATAGVELGDPVTYWVKPDPLPKAIHASSAPLSTMRKEAFDEPRPTDLLMTRDSASVEMFDLAGRRTLIMGKERGGIDEVWIHPLRILRDYQAGVMMDDSVHWLQNLRPRIEVRPESFTRRYAVGDLTITETLVASIDRAGGIACYESGRPVRLCIRFRADLRWMWPYDAQALGTLHYGYDPGLQALLVRDASGDFSCLFGADRRPAAVLVGHFGRIEWQKNSVAGTSTNDHQVAFGAEYDLGTERNNRLTFAFAGSNEGTAASERDYRALAGNPVAVHQAAAEHYRNLLATSVGIQSPDAEFNTLYQWAIVGADRFVARTPGLGTGLLAGFATTARGWNGEQKNSGRPGYAWYFGRDAAWSSFAVDGYGDFATVRGQLELYQQYQDLSGKIYHELMTSGVAHYDASDATPLYVMLAAHYLKASGDTAFIRKSWPHIRRAMDFLYSTDTDRDGLIENTDVGHGWVEPGGVLFGMHSEYYLSVLWAKALDAASFMAAVAGKVDLQERYSASARRVKEILSDDFWLSSTNFISHGKLRDGRFVDEHTAFPAVGLIWGLIDRTKAPYLLREYASSDFSTDWAVRGLSGASRYFQPRSYQEGAAWPLFTGWTALGEFTYGNSVQAFTHVKELMLIKTHWALGFVQEVMNGAVYRPSGVCFHQCWSETNILHPIFEGLIGWKPDAVSASASFSPRFPADWDSVTIHQLRVGKTVVNVKMVRASSTTSFTLDRGSGPACTVTVRPEILPGMQVDRVLVSNSPETQNNDEATGQLRRGVAVKVEDSVTLTIEHHGGLAMLPLVPRPAPGDSTQWPRLLGSDWKDSTLVVEVQGRPGITGAFPLRVFGPRTPVASGIEIHRRAQPEQWEMLVPFESTGKKFTNRIVAVSLK